MALQEAAEACLLAAQAWAVAAGTTVDASRKLAGAWLCLFVAAPVRYALDYSGARRLVPSWLPLPGSLASNTLYSSGGSTYAAAARQLAPATSPEGTQGQEEPEEPAPSTSPMAAYLAAGEQSGALDSGGASSFAAASRHAEVPKGEAEAEPGEGSMGGQVQGEKQGGDKKEGEEEERFEGDYDRLSSVPLSAAGTGTEEGLGAFMARQLSEATSEREPLLLSVPSSSSTAMATANSAEDELRAAAAASLAAEAAAAAAAAAFAEEAAAAKQPARPAPVENAEGADRLLAGEEIGPEGEQEGARSEALPPAVHDPALPPAVPEPALPPAIAETSLPPAIAEPSLPPTFPEPSLPPTFPEHARPPRELVRTAPGMPEEALEDERAPPLMAEDEQAQPMTSPHVPAAVSAGFTSGPSPLYDTQLPPAGPSAPPAPPGGSYLLPHSLAEAMDVPPPLPEDMSLSGVPGDGRAAQQRPVSASCGSTIAPDTPAAMQAISGVPRLPGRAPDNPAALPPTADRANTAFTAELASAALDLMAGGGNC